MAKQTIEQATERFSTCLTEMAEMIEAFEAKIAADNWKDEGEMLLAIEALGRAGARLYNAQKMTAGGGPFGLRDVVRWRRAELGKDSGERRSRELDVQLGDGDERKS